MIFKIQSALIVLFLTFLPTYVLAAPLQVPSPTPTPSRFFPVAAEIGEQITALVTGEAGVEIEPQPTFGTRALGVVLDSIKLIGKEATNFVQEFEALPELTEWFSKQANNPYLLKTWQDTGTLLLVVLAASLAAAWFFDLLLLPLRRRINRQNFSSVWTKMGGVIGWLLLSFIPVTAFVGVALSVIAYNEPTKLASFVVMTVIYALAVFRLVKVLARFVLAARVPNLRFIPMTTSLSFTIEKIIVWFSAVIIFGYFTTEIAKGVKMPQPSIAAFTSFIAFIVVVMAVALILRRKRAISSFIRGTAQSESNELSLNKNIRHWLSRTWHVLAIGYIVVGFFITTIGSSGGFLLMQKGTVGTLLTLLVMRMAFHMAAKIAYRRKAAEVSSGIYRTVLRLMFKALIWIVGAAGIFASWGVDVIAIVSSAWGQRVLGSVFSIASTLLLVVFAYEMMARAIERSLNKKDVGGNIIQTNTRARTLLPMVQKAAIMVLGVVVGLVTLSEFGINIAPILAGAGVLGVAIGFGSQTLVKDFLTGLSIILEDNMAVDDVVTTANLTGVVENLSIRTVRLRSFDGALHIVPFSEITTITNLTKAFSFAVLDLGVAYNSDLDAVIQLIKKVGDEMRKEPEFSKIILDDLEMFGVESLGDYAITIRSRIKTLPGQHHTVRRAFLLRIKKAFDVAGIEIPFPTVTQLRHSVNPEQIREIEQAQETGGDSESPSSS